MPMKTDNELIAEFMGNPLNVYVCTDTGGYTRRVDYSTYATSWDCLIPVVEKINSTLSNPATRYNYRHTITCMLPVTTPIEIVHHKVVEFIKWYNEQPK